MKRGICIFTIIFLMLISLASADIIITQQPANSYSMGDEITIPIKIKSVLGINNFFTIELLCNSQQTEVHKEYVALSPGEEKQITPTIPLILSFTGKSTGSCSIKTILGEEYKVTDDFEISNQILISIKEEETQFAPGKTIIIEGDATKSNQDFINGFIDLTLDADTIEPISISDTVKNSYFLVNFSLPADTKAGKYSVQITIYEKDFQGQITNTGSAHHNIEITQIPTSLEILFDTQEVEPGTKLQVKTILHDQTGESIRATSAITIQNTAGEILAQVEQPTNEYFEFPIEYNHPPEKLFVLANSNNLETESSFDIIEKQEVKVELMDKTVLITNVGNVLYDKTVLVKIGEESFSIATNLKVDESEKYVLTAPDGEYQIEIFSDGENKINGMATLTGKEIDVKKMGGGVIRVARNPFVWIFIIIILALVAFIVFRKAIKKSFFGRKPSEKTESKKFIPLGKKSLIKSSSPAKLSLSIKGDKQTASIATLKIKNLKEIQSIKSSAEQTLQKLVDLAEEQKAATYENQENIFFIFAPTKTKTFKNEKTSIDLANKALSILNNHNKLAKQKINFGIALTEGSIVAKQEANVLKFMSIGTLITSSKKISSIANQEILLGKTFREKARAMIKSEKQMKNGVEVYIIKEIKKDSPENKKFIHKFVERYEKENREKAKKKKK